MKRIFFLVVIAFCIIVNLNSKTYSQTPPCFPDYKGLSYQMDDIVNCPPYNSNMPLDVFIGYLALDSLSTNANYNDYNEFLKRQNYNDTLRTMMRYLYKTIEYNPNNYLCFMYHNKYSRRSIYYYHYGFIEKVLQKSPQPILDASLIGSYLIAKVHIDSIYRYIDSTSQPISSRLVRCSINQVFKGTTPIINNNQFIVDPVLQFEYSNEWFSHGNEDSTNSVFELEKGKSYIIFFEYRLLCRDSSHVYYTVFPFRSSYSGTACMYPIINGNVIDPSNELGFGTSVNINIFNAGLTNRINSIKNYTP